MKKFDIIFMAVFTLTGLSHSASFEEDVAAASKSVEAALPQPQMENYYETTLKDMSGFFNYLDNMAKTQRIESKDYFSFDKSGGKTEAQALYTVNLEKIRNEYLKSRITFKTTKGTTLHVSGSRASNCPDLSNNCKDKEKFFVTLTTSGGETFFVRAMDIINWGILMMGYKTVVIDGEKYVVKIYANASDPSRSRLEIKGPEGSVINSTLDKLGEAVADIGIDIKLSKAYKLAYGNEIVQTGRGNARFTDKKFLLMLPFSVAEASVHFLMAADDIKPSGTAFPSMEPGYRFALVNGVLEISKI